MNKKKFLIHKQISFTVTVLLLNVMVAFGQVKPAPDRTRGEGPFERLIIRELPL